MSATAQYIVQASVTVIGIGLLATLLLLANRRWGATRPNGPLTLLGQLPLGARRSVYLIEVGPMVYVLAAADNSLVKLGELERSALPPQMPQTSQSFADVLHGALGRQRSSSETVARGEHDAAHRDERRNSEAPVSEARDPTRGGES